MIKYTSGNILRARTEAIVNTVNCVGIMGKGLAFQFKEAYPRMFEDYVKACKNGEVAPGQMHVYRIDSDSFPKWIINFPTKRHPRDNSLIGDVDLGLIGLKQCLFDLKFESISIPPLGCGLGRLNWNDVKRLMEEHLGDVPNVTIMIYEP
jgi:O-acetyl-ADP-ribose deacetylase (regulator of RNase III)